MSNDYKDAILLDEISRRVLLLLSTGNKLNLEVIGHIIGESINAARYGVNILENKYRLITRDSNNNFQLNEAGVDYLRIKLGIPAKKPQSIPQEKGKTNKANRRLFSRIVDAIIWVMWASIPMTILILGCVGFLSIPNLILKIGAVLTLITLLIVYLRWSIFPVMEGSKIVIFRGGEYIDTKGPGPVLVVPLFYTTEVVDIRVKEQEIPHQTCITQDNVQIDIDFVYYWRIEIPEWSLTKVANPQLAIQLLATGILRAVIAKFSFSDVQKKRQTINDALKEEIDVIIREWGVNVTSIEIREVKASPEIVKAMEQARTAEWNRETMGILARGEAEALNYLRTVAYNLDKNTLNLKYFEVLRKLGEGQSTKYIFPMELSNLVQSWVQENQTNNNQDNEIKDNHPESGNGVDLATSNGSKSLFS